MINKKSKIDETNIKMYLGEDIEQHTVTMLQNIIRGENTLSVQLTGDNTLTIILGNIESYEYEMTNDTCLVLDIDSDPIGALYELSYKSHTHFQLEDRKVTHQFFIKDAIFRGETTLAKALQKAKYTHMIIEERDGLYTIAIKKLFNSLNLNFYALIQQVESSDAEVLLSMYTRLTNKKSHRMTYKIYRLWLHYLDVEELSTDIKYKHNDQMLEIDIKSEPRLPGTKAFNTLIGGGIRLERSHLFIVNKNVYLPFAQWFIEYNLIYNEGKNIKVHVVESEDDVYKIAQENHVNIEQTDIILLIDHTSNMPFNDNITTRFKSYESVYNAYRISASDTHDKLMLSYIKTRQNIQHGLRAPFYFDISNK